MGQLVDSRLIGNQHMYMHWYDICHNSRTVSDSLCWVLVYSFVYGLHKIWTKKTSVSENSAEKTICNFPSYEGPGLFSQVHVCLARVHLPWFLFFCIMPLLFSCIMFIISTEYVKVCWKKISKYTMKYLYCCNKLLINFCYSE